MGGPTVSGRCFLNYQYRGLKITGTMKFCKIGQIYIDLSICPAKFYDPYMISSECLK